MSINIFFSDASFSVMLEVLKNFTKAAKHTEISLYTFTTHSDSVFKVSSVYLVLATR